MELKEVQEKSIRTHMVKLIKLSRNLDQLLDRLLEYEVLSQEDVHQLRFCSDDETSLHLLYEIVISKLPYAFDLLLFALRDTDNDKMAELVENSATFGDNGARRVTRRRSSSEQYSKSETRSITIKGAEMGVTEILEDYSEYSKSKDFSNLLKTLKMQDFDTRYLTKGLDNFVFSATLILQEWTKRMQLKANVVMLSNLFDNDGNYECATRIRQMFDSFVDSGFGFDFPGNFTRKEGKIAEVLNDNPSFCGYPERLFLLLNLPLDEISNFVKENRFIPDATKMLREWTLIYPKSSSVDHLASALAFNGHFCTAEKVSHL